MVALPPVLATLSKTPVLRSEMPLGFTKATVSELPADPRYHTLGAVRIDFRAARSSESASYALFKSSAQAAAFARVEVGVTGPTRAQARVLLQLALGHLRRSER